MTLKLIIEKLELSNEKFISRDTLKKYCKELGMKYEMAVHYLTHYRYLERVLRGIFYIRSIEERKLDKLNITPMEAITKALEIKGVKNWYFGLESALKMEHLIHQHIAMETIITDSISRPRPFIIMGMNVRFIKINKKLTDFGILEKPARHSTKEKTVLDMIYLAKYNGSLDDTILKKILEITEGYSKKALREYAKHYPQTVQRIMEKAL